MKNDPAKKLTARLNQIREELDVLARPESKTAFLKSLDDLIVALSSLRAGLVNPTLAERVAEIQKPLEQVMGFLEFAKSDDALKTILAQAKRTKVPKPKRVSVEIPSNLTNEQIRALIEKDLSKAELKAIAGQRAISVGKSNNEEIKRDILKNLERQEGYGRLAAS